MKTLITLVMLGTMLSHNTLSNAADVYGTINNSNGTSSIVTGTIDSRGGSNIMIYNQDGTNSQINTLGGIQYDTGF